MDCLNNLLKELGISKVRLAKYLGVSRQMLYNYLALENLDEWPAEKSAKLKNLFQVEEIKELDNIEINNEYIKQVEERLNEGVRNTVDKEMLTDLKGFSRKEQDLLINIVNLIKEEMQEDKEHALSTFSYLYNYLQSMNTNQELKYILAYMSKSMGFTEPLEFAYDDNKQFIFEAILFSGLTLYNNGSASKSKLADSHKRFVEDINQKKEDKLSRTQELNTAKVMALKELKYDEINEENAKEVLEKIAEIQSRKV